MKKTCITAIACGAYAAFSTFSAMAMELPNISVVLDGYYQDGNRQLGTREQGFNLGHTELALSAPVDDKFYGKLTTVLETTHGETELELEEAFFQILALPYGVSVRGGRFLSDIGYLNNQHLHTDDFVERPAVYRALLGSHYFDDGARLNWIAPTDLFVELGAEAFKGQPLRGESDSDRTVGVYHLYSKLGGDIGNAHSWQTSFSWLRNDQLSEQPHEDQHSDEGHEHEHSHGAEYVGQDLYNLALTYKWAPAGNYKYQHLTLSGEWFYLNDPVTEAHEHEHDESESEPEHQEQPSADHYDGWYLSGVYQFTPSWSAGVRYGQLSADEFKLKETEAMIAWHASHFSTIRLAYSHQDPSYTEHNAEQSAAPFDEHIVTLQYIMTLGAHSAHQF